MISNDSALLETDQSTQVKVIDDDDLL